MNNITEIIIKHGDGEEFTYKPTTGETHTFCFFQGMKKWHNETSGWDEAIPNNIRGMIIIEAPERKAAQVINYTTAVIDTKG